MNDQGITKSVKKYKLVFIGDQSVGKTSIITRFIYDSYSGAKQVKIWYLCTKSSLTYISANSRNRLCCEDTPYG